MRVGNIEKNRPVLRIFAWFWLVASSLPVWANPAVVPQTDAQKTYWEAWKKLDAMEPTNSNGRPNKAFATQAKLVMNLAGAVLTEHQVVWSWQREVIAITPLKKGHAFNQLAYGSAQNLKGLKLVFDPKELIQDGAGAEFEEEIGWYFFSAEDILSGQIGEYVFHEIRHAFLQRRLLDGHDSPYFGYFERLAQIGAPSSGDVSPEPAEKDPYAKKFSFDEVSAYTAQVHRIAVEMSKAKPDDVDAYLSDIVYFTNIVTELAVTLNQNLKDTELALADFAQQPSAWGRGHQQTLTVLENDFTVTSYSRSGASFPAIRLSVYQDRIHFGRQWKNAGFVSVDSLVSRVLYGIVDARIYKNLKDGNIGEVAQALGQKSQILRGHLDRLLELFEKIREAAKLKDVTAILTASRNAMPEIKEDVPKLPGI